MSNCKGTLYLSVKLFAERKYGEPAVARCLAEMSEADQQLLQSIVAIGWYPLEPIVRFHRVLDRLYGKGDLSLCYDIGRFSADWQLNSFHKLILHFKSPAWMVQKAGTMWRSYHDTGEWQVEATRRNEIVGRLRGFGLVDEAFCQRERGWFHRAVELTGGKQPVLREPHCRARGDTFCEYRGTWS